MHTYTIRWFDFNLNTCTICWFYFNMYTCTCVDFISICIHIRFLVSFQFVYGYWFHFNLCTYVGFIAICTRVRLLVSFQSVHVYACWFHFNLYTRTFAVFHLSLHACCFSINSVCMLFLISICTGMHLHLLFLTTIITVVYFCFISNLLYSYIARNDR